MDELIYYDESVGQKQIDAKQAYPPTKKKSPSTLLPYPIAKIRHSSQLFAHFYLVLRKVVSLFEN